MSENLIEINDLSAGYGGVPVVRGLSLTVKAGEVVALLGPNGAGKTTTLLTISGILRPLGGAVTVLGQPVLGGKAFRIARRGLAHVAEDRSLFFDLTVNENIRLGLTGSRGDRKEALDRAMMMFPALEPLRTRRAGLLSGGEQQMLALARALVASPKMLLVDEMSLGLAPLVVADLATTVRRVADELGIGILLVEQHVQVALDIADRAIVLRHGESVLTAAAVELRGAPEALQAAYLGH